MVNSEVVLAAKTVSPLAMHTIGRLTGVCVKEHTNNNYCVCMYVWKSIAGWRSLYCAGLESCRETQVTRASVVVRDVVCEVCSRSFSREGDNKRHKCLNERRE